MMYRIIWILALIVTANSAVAPFLKPCSLEDKDCVLSSAQAAVSIVAAGLPTLAVPAVDPLHLPLITSSQSGLQLVFKDTVVTGMKGCSVDAVKLDTAKNKQITTIRCSVLLNGDYKMSGRLLLLPITGEGKYSIMIRDIVIKTFADIKYVQGADGKAHWHIANWRHSFDVKTLTHFTFENLFNGNELLAKPIIEFLNTNWRDVMKELAPPVVKAIVAKVVESVDALYKAVPVDELSQ